MLRALLPAGAIVHAVILLSLGYPAGSRTVFLPLLCSLLSLVPLPDRLTGLISRCARSGARAFVPALLLAAAALTLFYGSTWHGRGAAFRPVVHDEHAYLFQAKTFAAGHLSYPSPPEPLFFDALHLLTEPVFAAKYPPGHALWLTPWQSAGMPWLGPLLAVFLALLLIGIVTRTFLGPWGAVTLVLLFGLSPAEMKVAPTFLSQNTYLLGVFFFGWLFSRWVKSGGRAIHAGAAGALLGWLFFTRPLNTSVLMIAAAVTLLTLILTGTTRLTRRGTVSFVLLLAVAGGFGLQYNRAITGSITDMPWQHYARSYTPEDRLGFYRGEPLEKREIGPGKRMWLEQVLYPSWTRYTPSFAISKLFQFRIPYTFKEAAPFFILILLVPLFLRGRHRPVALLASLYIVLLHSAYLWYWFPWSNYYHEISPVLLFLPLLGGTVLARRALSRGNGSVMIAVGALLLLALHGNYAQLPAQIRFIESKPVYHERFARAIEQKTATPAIVFVRYGRNHNSELDLINNEPDLSNAGRIYVHDLGAERNYRFQDRYFPDRKPYLYVEMSGRVFAGFDRN